MYKVALVVEYDGSRYHGFQYQANAPTIQAEIELALKQITGENIRVRAASRHLGRIRCALSSALEARGAGRGLGYHIALRVSEGDDSIVKGGLNIGAALGHHFLFAAASCCTLPGSHANSLLTCGPHRACGLCRPRFA